MFTETVLTVSEGKRLIAKGVAKHPDVLKALSEGTVVICKGTTNAYVVEELLGKPIKRTDYVTGKTVPKSMEGKPITSASLPDVVIQKGKVLEGVSSKDVLGQLKAGDVFIKGANAISYERGQAALLIGHPTGGTIGAAVGTLVARRVTLLVPAGLEKNIPGDLDEIAACMAAVDECEPQPIPAFWPVPGELFTEIEAIELLSGCDALQTAAGGIAGAEGAVRLLLHGTKEQVADARRILSSVIGEPPFITG
jgi:hypothetical protein